MGNCLRKALTVSVKMILLGVKAHAAEKHNCDLNTHVHLYHAYPSLQRWCFCESSKIICSDLETSQLDCVGATTSIYY
jgi:hypothetical protein